VIAAGAHSALLTGPIGLRLPLQGAKGYHRDREPGSGAPTLGKTVMFGERSVYCAPMSGFLRYAGTLEFSGLNLDLRKPRLEQLSRSASLYLHDDQAESSRSEWCGLRPCLPDGYPAVGAVPGVRGLFVATGHATLGLTLGPVSGKLLAEIILDGRASMNIDAFGVDRFTRRHR